jgi:hypothetical protein
VLTLPPDEAAGEVLYTPPLPLKVVRPGAREPVVVEVCGTPLPP